MSTTSQDELPTLPPSPSDPEGATLPPAATQDFVAAREPVARDDTLSLPAAVPGYELLGELGRGGMGVVYKARQGQLQRLVALKMLLADGHAGSADLARFRTEAEAIARLQHPNIVQVHEIGEHEGKPYFSLEYCAGGSLAQQIDGTPWPPEQAARMVETLARGMDAAHQKGIIHRDLKPANILLQNDDCRLPNGKSAIANLQSAIPKISDFGLAKKLDDVGQTQSGSIMGTPSYMAPEQAGGKTKEMGPAVDIYALGAILYELLTGRPPFKAATPLDTILQVVSDEPVPPRQLQSKTPKDLETICLKCLQKEPRKRYAGAVALAEDLCRFQEGEPILARPVGKLERLIKWARRRPAVAALVALSVLAPLGLLVVGLVFSAEADVERQAARQANAEASQRSLEAKQAGVEAEQGRLAARQAKTEADKERQAAKEAKQKAAQLVTEAEGLRLVAHAAVELPKNPTLSLLLAVEGAQRGPRLAAHNNALLAAWNACREQAPQLRHGTRFDQHFVNYLPDGKRVLTADLYDCRVWDVASGRQLVIMKGPQLHITSVHLSPDGRRVAVTYQGNRTTSYQGTTSFYTDRGARIWDTETGKEICVLRGHEDRVVSARFSPDGKRVITASWDTTARIWNAETGREHQVLKGHESSLSSAVFNPDGRWVITVSSGTREESSFTQPAAKLQAKVDPLVDGDGVEQSHGFGSTRRNPQREATFARIWDAETGKEVTRFLTTSYVTFPTSVTLSPDGKQLVATSRVSSLWDAQTGTLRYSLQARDEPTGQKLSPLEVSHNVMSTSWSAVFSPDGKYVLPLYRDKLLRIWDAATGKEVALLQGHEGEITFARFSPNSQHVLTTSKDRTARLWEAATGRELLALRGHELEVYAADFRGDGRAVVTASADGTARFWDVGPRREFATVYQEDKGRVWSAALTPDGRRLVTGSFAGTLRIRDIPSGNEVAVMRGHEQLPAPLRGLILGEILGITFSRDGSRMLTVSADKGYYMQNSKDSLRGARPDQKNPGPFTPVRIWEVKSGKELTALRGLTSYVRSAAFNADGTRVLTVPHPQPPPHIYVSPTGQPTGSGGGGASERKICLWDATTGARLFTLENDGKLKGTATWSAAFSPDGGRVCTVDGSQTGWLWDTATGTKLFQLASKLRVGNSVAFSPDGRRLLTWSDSTLDRVTAKAALLWDAETGNLVATLSGHQVGVNSAGFSLDGRWVVTTAEAMQPSASGGDVGIDDRYVDNLLKDRTARLWDATHGKLHVVLRGHTRAVHSAAFSRDSKWVVTTSEDRTARVWEVATGRELITLTGHQDALKSAAFSPDGTLVLTTSWDGTARLWPIDPLALVLARKPRELTKEERTRFEVPMPPAYDPTRLGPDLIWGQTWQDRSFAADDGYSSLTSMFGGWTDDDGGTASPDVLSLANDPHGIFGTVVRLTTPANPKVVKKSATAPKPKVQKRKTAQYTVVFDEREPGMQSQERVWARALYLMSGSGTSKLGGSTAHKLVSLHPKSGTGQLHFDLHPDGRFLTPAALGGDMAGDLPQGGAPVPPRAAAAHAVNAQDQAHDACANRDWYEYIINYERLSATEYLTRYFVRRLTVAGVWQPWTYPVWHGSRIVKGTAVAINRLAVTAKGLVPSSSSPHYFYIGPVEVTKAIDPYGLDAYGKEVR